VSKSDRLDLARYFPYLINRVGAVFVTDFTRDALAPEELTIVMWRVLAALSNNGGQRQTDLAAMTSIEVSTLSRVVARLLKRGLITRQRSRADNREVAVTLSARGKMLVQRLIPIARAHEEKATGKLSASDLEVARRVLRVMYGNLAAQPAKAEKKVR
jgi:DNA-binding MarR family transcriptional regulator